MADQENERSLLQSAKDGMEDFEEWVRFIAKALWYVLLFLVLALCLYGAFTQ